MTTSTEKAVLSHQDTLKEVIGCLTEHISIKTQGACNQTDLFNILVAAASKADTIENTASSLKKSSSAKNIRYHLAKFQSFPELETQLNLALISRLPRRIKKRKLKLAIDLNLIPYYGKPSFQEQDYIYRSQAKNGTCSFYAYASLYVIAKNKRAKISKPRRGGRLIYRKLFNLKQMLAFLSNAVNQIYEVREIVYIPSG